MKSATWKGKPMDTFVNANIAYLLLLFGSIALLMALLTPGTHLIEGVTFLLLFLAGYEIFRLGFNWWALVVLVLSLVPFLYSIRKPGHSWALALSIIGVIAGSLYLFPGTGFVPAVNPILAVVMSALSGAFLWFATRKIMLAIRARPLQDMERLVGQIGQTRTEVQVSGSVQVASELWSARSSNAIPAGSWVRVVGREGFTLVVEPKDQSH
jgi:membrane-bound serine protease (ClpP class)